MPEWKVYIEDFNHKEIRELNVFNHHSFREDCIKHLRKYKTEDQLPELNEQIRRSAMYYFWSKCEYEIILTAWPPPKEGSDFRDKKIDVYDQLMMNWEYFFKYIVDHKKELLKKRKE